jgi:hypothetical protein
MGQPPAKRQRLESIVVMRKEPEIQKPYQRPQQSWSSGSLPPMNRGGRGGRGRGRGYTVEAGSPPIGAKAGDVGLSAAPIGMAKVIEPP